MQTFTLKTATVDIAKAIVNSKKKYLYAPKLREKEVLGKRSNIKPVKS